MDNYFTNTISATVTAVRSAIKTAWANFYVLHNPYYPQVRLEISPDTGLTRLMARHTLHTTDQTTGATATLCAYMEVQPHDSHYQYFWRKLSKRDRRALDAQQTKINKANNQIFFIN